MLYLLFLSYTFNLPTAPSSFLFRPNIIFSLLNIINTVDLVNAFKEDKARVRLFTLGSFFHGVDFTRKLGVVGKLLFDQLRKRIRTEISLSQWYLGAKTRQFSDIFHANFFITCSKTIQILSLPTTPSELVSVIPAIESNFFYQLFSRCQGI